ncbi:HesB/IscA family protein [Fimbriimonas ginsengisoli]|uniref:Putative iron binding protein from the HesB_IscA_SufA family n=1 Tax=Fimbriimonas ginsengisoli Gsoil 348 TaxID=661478 RepID=A0A068NK04_FIMGI|nr:iron-sulfur cluster assembly accessory protein [Fimbriimonas ginsengisoli]AIE83923.1 putative iron binding protein from the HesB_IscA_SufA family [Fimbriimonas ginsengisoli Gsoil 348]
MEETFPVTLTPAALAQIRRLLAKDGRPDVFLRLGVKGGGCSGFEYVTKLDTVRRPIDLYLEIDGLTIACDKKSAVYLNGSTFDYTGNLIGGGFKFENPNVSRSCGCGTSFTPKVTAG